MTATTIDIDDIWMWSVQKCTACGTNPIRSTSFLRDTIISPIICFRVDFCVECWKLRPLQTCLLCDGNFPADGCRCASCFTEHHNLKKYQICSSCLFFQRMQRTDTDVYAYSDEIMVD